MEKTERRLGRAGVEVSMAESVAQAFFRDERERKEKGQGELAAPFLEVL
jgi:hypothetical protein